MVDTGRATKPQHWAGEVITLGRVSFSEVPFVFIHRVMGGEKILNAHQTESLSSKHLAKNACKPKAAGQDC